MYNIFHPSFIELSRLFLRLTVVVQQDVLWFEVSVRWENKEQSRWDGKKQSDDEIKRLGELKLTCRRCVLGAGPPARSRSLRSRRRLSSRRSPRRPCDRCETSGLLRSSASTRGTERPSSRRRTLNSPGDRSGVTLREVTRKTRECETADATRTCSWFSPQICCWLSPGSVSRWAPSTLLSSSLSSSSPASYRRTSSPWPVPDTHTPAGGGESWHFICTISYL